MVRKSTSLFILFTLASTLLFYFITFTDNATVGSGSVLSAEVVSSENNAQYESPVSLVENRSSSGGFDGNATETFGSDVGTENSVKDESFASAAPSLGEDLGTGSVAASYEDVGTENSGKDESFVSVAPSLVEDEESSGFDEEDVSSEVIESDTETEENEQEKAVFVVDMGQNGSNDASEDIKEMPLLVSSDSKGEEKEQGKVVLVGNNGSYSAFEERKEIPLTSQSGFGESVPSLVQKFEDLGLGTRRCDIYDGRWVFDDSYPIYTGNSCPFIDDGFNCEANGRIDTGYMKWRWQPHSCDIPRFDPVKMLEMIRGKRLVFVGDSINRNQWESMLCLLSGAISDRSRVYEARKRRITKYNGNYNFKFPDYGCSVEYYVTHFLVQESKARVGDKRRKTLRIDAVDKTSSRWRGADILVFNSAHWWSHHKTKAGLNYFQEGNQVYSHLDVSSAFRKALVTWASWVDKHVTPHNTQVFFRSSSPSHFSGGEWNSGGHCKESTQPLNNTFSRQIPEMNIILEQTVKQMRTPVTILNITNLSGLRIDGHPSIYGQKPENGRRSNIQDCSHWCLPGVPDIWNQLLYYELLSSRKNTLR